MRNRLKYTWGQLRSTYWFIPISMAIAAAILALVLISIDDATATRRVPGFPQIGPSGAHALLSTITGASITVAAVVFSITMVILSTVSNQFGPRLIPNFMKHNTTQVILGGFIGTFIYCLLVLSQVEDNGTAIHVPQIALAFGLLLGMLNFVLLIYFFHSVSKFIQAERLIDEVASEIVSVFSRVFPSSIEDKWADNSEDDKFIPPDGFQENAATVIASSGGYIETVDVNRIIGIAAEYGLVVHLLHRPGAFVFVDHALARVIPPEAVTDDISDIIRGSFLIYGQRTSMQDPEFAVDQMVEICIRALSPSINDSFTAINCIDRLGAGLSFLASRRIPSHLYRDDKAQLRVIAQPYTYANIINTAFSKVRQAAKTNCAVTLRLLEVIDTVAQRDLSDSYREALKQQAQLIYRGSLNTFFQSGDTPSLNKRYDQVLRSLAASD